MLLGKVQAANSVLTLLLFSFDMALFVIIAATILMQMMSLIYLCLVFFSNYALLDRLPGLWRHLKDLAQHTSNSKYVLVEILIFLLS